MILGKLMNGNSISKVTIFKKVGKGEDFKK